MEKNIFNKIEITLADLERGYTSSYLVSAVFGAFVLYIAHNTPGETALDAILKANNVSKLLSEVIKDRIGDHWNKYLPLLTAFSKEELGEFFENSVNGEHLCEAGRMECFTSSMPIVELVTRILDIKRGESVCDLCCSAGDFIRRAYFAACKDLANPDFAGYELVREAAAIAEIRMKCDELDVRIVNSDVFAKDTLCEKFDKVFSDPPLSVRGLAEKTDVRDIIHKAFPDFPELYPSTQGDWLFAARAVAAMNDGGKAAVILPPSAMFGTASEPYRRYFVLRNLIEAIIELPARIFEHTGITTYLVIFKAGSEKIKMVRAGELCEKGRRINIIRDAHVRTIMGALGLLKSGKTADFARYVVEVVKQDILENDCDLSVKKYFADPVAIRDGISFGNFVISAKRGAAVSSDELDKLASKNETDYLYIASGNINDGVVDAQLMNLTGVPEKYHPYCARNGDIVITRVMSAGADFKTAVIDVPEGKVILPNGNLLIVTVDRTRTDPYFIKACLDNQYAQRYLQNSAVGASSITLNYRNLENLPIPNLPLERQKEIANECRENAKKVLDLRIKLAAAKNSLGSVLADTASDCFVSTSDQTNQGL